MKTNFEIEDNYAVVVEGHLLDLRDDFDFIEMEDDEKNRIVLKFIRATGDWVKETKFKHLAFVFKNVSYKYLEDGDQDALPDDSKCLGEITFFPSELREEHTSLIPQRQPKQDDDIIFFFEDGRIIRVSCEEAELIADE